MPEISMLIGIPGSGKSSVVNAQPGTVVLSRDKEGGKTTDLLPKVSGALATGAKKVILDCYHHQRRASSTQALESCLCRQSSSVRLTYVLVEQSHTHEKTEKAEKTEGPHFPARQLDLELELESQVPTDNGYIAIVVLPKATSVAEVSQVLGRLGKDAQVLQIAKQT